MGHLTSSASAVAVTAPAVTEAWLLSQGVRFECHGAQLECFGPPDLGELYAVMREEIARRTALIVAGISGSDRHRPAPLVVIGPATEARTGSCMSCGDPMLHYRGGQCSLCIAALGKALLAVGRLKA